MGLLITPKNDGFEPYINATLITPLEVMGQMDSNTSKKTDCNLGAKEAICTPMTFKQDVKITKVLIKQTNASSNSSDGLIGIYKYNSIVIDAHGTNYHSYTFDKIYQETSTFDLSSSLANSIQEITLTTPQTLLGGEFYVVVLAYETTSNASQFLGYTPMGVNKFLGVLDTGGTPDLIRYITLVAEKYPPVKGAPNVDIVSGVLPNQISFKGDPDRSEMGGVTFAGFTHITVKNA